MLAQGRKLLAEEAVDLGARVEALLIVVGDECSDNVIHNRSGTVWIPVRVANFDEAGAGHHLNRKISLKDAQHMIEPFGRAFQGSTLARFTAVCGLERREVLEIEIVDDAECDRLRLEDLHLCLKKGVDRKGIDTASRGRSAIQSDRGAASVQLDAARRLIVAMCNQQIGDR